MNPRPSTPRRAALFFGLPLDDKLTEDLVRAAFNRVIRESHPDAGDGGEAAVTIEHAKVARTVLVSYLVKMRGHCPRCNGTGRTQIPGTLRFNKCHCNKGPMT